MSVEKRLILIGIILLIVVIGGEIWYQGIKKTINSNPTYGELVGKKYEAKIDLYISQDRQSARYFIEVPGWHCPQAQDIKQYPYGGVSYIIHKLVPKGSVFTITNILLTNKPFRGKDIWLMGKFDDSRIFSDEICVNSVSDYNSNHEKMDPEYVTEITPEGEPVNDK